MVGRGVVVVKVAQDQVVESRERNKGSGLLLLDHEAEEVVMGGEQHHHPHHRLYMKISKKDHRREGKMKGHPSTRPT